MRPTPQEAEYIADTLITHLLHLCADPATVKIVWSPSQENYAMPAFGEARTETIRSTIIKLYQRQVAFLYSGLETQDVLDTWVNPMHHEMCREVPKLFGMSGRTAFSTAWNSPDVGAAKITVQLMAGDTILPKYVGSVTQPFDTSEVSEKVERWVTRRVTAARVQRALHPVYDPGAGTLLLGADRRPAGAQRGSGNPG
jgi:hypothetical protein